MVKCVMSASSEKSYDSTQSAYPSDVTFHDLIARNKRNSVLLVLLMAVLVIAVAEVIALAIGSYSGMQITPIYILGVAGIGALVMTAVSSWAYFGGSNTILSMSGAREIQHTDDPQLFNIVEELCLAGNMPMPKVYLIDSKAMNAFATGRDPEHAAVAITTGLRERLNRDELTGVMAHELAHIRHYDIRLTMLMATMVGLIVLMCDMFLDSIRFSGGRGSRRSSGDKGGGAVIVLIVIALLLAVIAPLLAKMIQFAVSRQREFLADAGAVELSRNPIGLRDALLKLGADDTHLDHANRATAHMFIVNPFQAEKHTMELDSAFATHPPLTKRVIALNALLGASA